MVRRLWGDVCLVVIEYTEWIKEVLLNTSVSYDNVGFNPLSKLLFGDGLLGTTGLSIGRVRVIHVGGSPLCVPFSTRAP